MDKVKNYLMALQLMVACVFYTHKSFAQASPFFEDTFISNSNGWNLGKGYNYNDVYTLEGGKFIVKSENIPSFVKAFGIDLKKDFAVELVFSFSKEESNETAMITFQDRTFRPSSFLSFIIHGTNEFTAVEGTSEGSKELAPYTSFFKINFKEKNCLKIEKKGTKTTLFINNKPIAKMEDVSFPGNAVGMRAGQGLVTLYRFTILHVNEGTVVLPKEEEEVFVKELLGGHFMDIKRGISMHLSPDGNTMYVNVRDKEDIYKPDLYGCDDIYFSNKSTNGDWGPFAKMPTPINGPESNDMISISPDNNTLFMSDTSCTPTKVFHHYISHRTTNGWSKLKRMQMHDVYNNTTYSNSVLSADGKTIILYLKMNDATGPSDMYVSHLLEDSSWSKPINITSLNSVGTDIPNFIAADNKTFYFASDGRPGYGSMDIYMTKRLDDTWLNWSKPRNMGSEINGKGWDCYFVMDARAEYAYFTSDDNNKHSKSRFFRIKLPQDMRPSSVVLVKGKVVNAVTDKPVEATLYYEILPEGKEAGVARSNPQTGEYKLILPYGKHYGYRAEAKGYITVNENFDLVDEKQYNELEKDLLLVPIEVGQTIKLNNIFFVQSKSELLIASYPELDRLSKILNDNPTIKIQLRGYTDNMGSAKKNLQLSKDRVNVVRTYLINRGIADGRITGVGLGGTNLVSKDTTEEGRKLNRRVEFVILSK